MGRYLFQAPLAHLPCMFKNLLVMWRSAAFSVSENIAAISALIRSGRSSAQSSRSHRALMELCFLRESIVSLSLHFSPHIFHSSRKSHSRDRCRQSLSWCSGSISCGVPPRRRKWKDPFRLLGRYQHNSACTWKLSSCICVGQWQLKVLTGLDRTFTVHLDSSSFKSADQCFRNWREPAYSNNFPEVLVWGGSIQH